MNLSNKIDKIHIIKIYDKHISSDLSQLLKTDKKKKTLCVENMNSK